MNWFALSAFLAATSNVAIGVFVLARTHRNPRNIFYACMTFCLALWASVDFIIPITDPNYRDALFIDRFSYLGASFVPSTFLCFSLWLVQRPSKRLASTCLGASLLFSVLSFATSLIIADVSMQPFREIPGPLYPGFIIFFVGCLCYGLWIIWRALQISQLPYLRNQFRYVLVAVTSSLVALIVFTLMNYRWAVPPIHYLIEVGVVFTTAYAIAQYRLMDSNLAITRAVLIAIIYIPLLALPILLGNIFQPALISRLGLGWWIVPTLAEAVFAVAGLVIYRYVQEKAENRLLAEQRRYQATLRQASEGMTRIRQLPRLLKLTAGILSRAVGLTHVSIYLQDGETKRYVQQVSKGKDGPTGGPGLELDDPLIKYLLVHKNAIVAEELHIQRQQAEDPGLREVETSLRRLGAALVIPSFIHDQLLGFVVMSAKRSGKIYTGDDIKVLMTLANQAALAIENARFYEAEKERQAEMFHTAQLASLGTMAGSMSHQINNRFHMEGIVAGAQRFMWEGTDLANVPEPVKELIQKTIVALKKIENDAIRGGDIAKTLLDFSKPGKMDRITFSEVINLTTDLAQYRVRFDEIDFEPVLSNPLPLLDGNKNQLTESFFNLMANAYDAIKRKEETIKEGGMTLLAGQSYKGRIAISASSTTKNGAIWLQAVVHDNGIGIKQEDLSRLFVPFFTTKGAEKGTGLGLYVIKKIIENHGGKLEVASVYGEGTTFTIHLPAAKER